MSQLIHVAAGIIYDDEKRILIARKRKGLPMEGFWEFPGGKVENGESFNNALKRELKEELNIEINNIQPFLDYEYISGANSLSMHSFTCKIFSGKPTITDHDAFEWAPIHDFKKYNFSPADLPIIKNLMLTI